jgi:4a-hydroxytetrahydrobiopterin dehydratase
MDRNEKRYCYSMHTESDWSESEDGLRRTIEFPSFRDAIGFVDRVADLAEAENHHPDLDVRYRKVTVTWTTHSAGGVTERDRALAVRTDELLADSG